MDGNRRYYTEQVTRMLKTNGTYPCLFVDLGSESLDVSRQLGVYAETRVSRDWGSEAGGTLDRE